MLASCSAHRQLQCCFRRRPLKHPHGVVGIRLELAGFYLSVALLRFSEAAQDNSPTPFCDWSCQPTWDQDFIQSRQKTAVFWHSLANSTASKSLCNSTLTRPLVYLTVSNKSGILVCLQEEQHNTDMQGQRPSMTLSSLELFLHVLQVHTAWPRVFSART